MSSQKLSKYTSWCNVWIALEKFGWFCFFLEDHTHVWASPNCSGVPKEEICSKFRKGKDFFLSEKALQKYARRTFDWKGPEYKKRRYNTRSVAAKKRKKNREKANKGRK